MTKKAIKEMLADIINNGAQYEVKKCNRECKVNDGLYCDCECKKWAPYELGEEINPNWEYRKVDYYYVVKMAVGKPYIISKFADSDSVFKSRSIKECEDWISKKQNWFETWQSRMSLNFALNGAQGSSLGIVNFAKKLLEEIHKQSYYADTYKEPEVIKVENIFEIIKDLGVTLE